MDLVFVTSNDLKYKAAKKILDVNLERVKLPLVEIQGEPREIAIFKAQEAFKKLNKPLIINDSSFCIPSLNNFPGPYTSYVEKTLGSNILKLMEGNKNRVCYYLDILVYIDAYSLKVIETKTYGTLALTEASGDYYPLDKIFIKEGDNKPICYNQGNMYENNGYVELNNYLKKRKVSRGIVFFADKVLLLYRKRLEDNKYLEYYAIPGGGIEKDETKEDACLRELFEETSIKTNIITYLESEEYDTGICYYYLVNYISGDIKLGGEELEKNNPDNYYEVRLVPVSELDNIYIYGKGSEIIKEVYKKYRVQKDN